MKKRKKLVLWIIAGSTLSAIAIAIADQLGFTFIIAVVGLSFIFTAFLLYEDNETKQ